MNFVITAQQKAQAEAYYNSMSDEEKQKFNAVFENSKKEYLEKKAKEEKLEKVDDLTTGERRELGLQLFEDYDLEHLGGDNWHRTYLWMKFVASDWIQAIEKRECPEEFKSNKVVIEWIKLFFGIDKKFSECKCGGGKEAIYEFNETGVI
jgi:hypothetical protein